MKQSFFTYIKIIGIFIFSLIYAILRYNLLGNVAFEEIPLFITNKAIAITIIFLLLFSIQKKTKKWVMGKLIKIIFILTTIHVFISFRLLGPEHYKKFYFENELNLFGYSTIFFGILILNSDNKLPTEKGKLKIPNYFRNIIRKLIPIFIALHLFSVGILGWISPKNWPGYLIPISLIAFVILSFYLKRIFTKKE